jgi:hypothetical protein
MRETVLVIHVNVFTKKIEGGYSAIFENGAFVAKVNNFPTREFIAEAIKSENTKVAILYT